MIKNYRKDTYYFSHDCNAKDDTKCMFLIDQLGLEGYGIFWVIVETLREQSDFTYPLALLPILARRYNTTAEKMKVVVTSYGLFKIIDDSIFYSESLMRRMKIYLDRKKVLSEAGKRGNAIRWKNSIATRSLSDHKAIAIKEKEIKEKENLLLREEIQEEVNLESYFKTLQIPQDGIERNFDALQRILKDELKVSINDAQKICTASNYGQLGTPFWTLIKEVKDSNGKIHSPVAFILSKLK